jgi:hypothetical protein
LAVVELSAPIPRGLGGAEDDEGITMFGRPGGVTGVPVVEICRKVGIS